MTSEEEPGPRRIRFGLWYDFRNPEPRALGNEALYRALLDQIVWGEDAGFESVWLTEHHFCDDGYTPSPLAIAAAIGERTQRMRIGTNLMLMPLADPIRLAEDAATLAILTGGRFDLGLGLGYREVEFEQFGRRLRERPSLMEEGVAILRRAWTGEPVQFEGKRFRVGPVRITPVPERPPRILLGGMAEPAIRRAARIGDGFLSTGGIGHDVYERASAEEGRRGAIFAGHWAIVAEDPEAELERVGPHVLYQANEYVRWGAFGPPDQVPPFPDAASAARDGLYQLWTPEQAIEGLVEMLRAHPAIEDLHFWAGFPGEPIEQRNARLELMARRVLPGVREALGLSGEASRTT